MGYILKEFLDAPAIYGCLQCQTHIARRDSVISRTFQGRLGRAYLTETVVNGRLGAREDRLLITGLHTVCNL
ncbi:Protein yippee-like 2, partial [Coemansia sp. RSA 2603]